MLAPAKTDLQPEKSGGVSLWYIATRAGIADRSDAWVLNYARMLVANNNFPAPLPYYSFTGKAREGIHFGSRWLRAAVDAWFDGLMPPHLCVIANDAAIARDGLKLDQRANALCGAQGAKPAAEQRAAAASR